MTCSYSGLPVLNPATSKSTALSTFNPVSLGLPIPTCLTHSLLPVLLNPQDNFLFLFLGQLPFSSSLKASYPTFLVVVEMFCQRLPSGWRGGTLRVLVRLIIGGYELQSHFVFIAEWWARALNVLLLCKLFSAAWRCGWDFICPMEERVVHLVKGQKTRHFQYILYLDHNKTKI